MFSLSCVILSRRSSTLYPIFGQMERAAGLGYNDRPQAKLDKLKAVLGLAI
jgi:hypothetical protein